MKLLVYGFEPFGKDKRNISAEVIKRLTPQPGLRTAVLPVKFSRDVFIQTALDNQPDLILGLGQYPRGQKIRIERRAKNQRGLKRQPASKIAPQGPHQVAATLRLRPDKDSWVSYNAGKYVCNFSAYVLLTDKRTAKIRYAFLHIPKACSLTTATQFVEKQLKSLVG